MFVPSERSTTCAGAGSEPCAPSTSVTACREAKTASPMAVPLPSSSPSTAAATAAWSCEAGTADRRRPGERDQTDVEAVRQPLDEVARCALRGGDAIRLHVSRGHGQRDVQRDDDGRAIAGHLDCRRWHGERRRAPDSRQQQQCAGDVPPPTQARDRDPEQVQTGEPHGVLAATALCQDIGAPVLLQSRCCSICIARVFFVVRRSMCAPVSGSTTCRMPTGSRLRSRRSDTSTTMTSWRAATARSGSVQCPAARVTPSSTPIAQMMIVHHRGAKPWPSWQPRRPAAPMSRCWAQESRPPSSRRSTS